MAAKGTKPQSYVAIDELMFVEENDKNVCELSPPEAQPVEPPTTPTPTEPPNSNFESKILFRITFDIMFTLDIIICTFEEDLCGFELNSIDNQEHWHFIRATSEELSNQGIVGPDLDYMGVKSGHFMLATDELKGHEEFAMAEMKSPYFKSSEHPKECLSFWFYFNIEDTNAVLAVFLEDDSASHIQDLWRLTSGWSEVDGWDEGRVEFSIDNPSAEEKLYRIVFVAAAGERESTYIALDEVQFIASNLCEFYPPEADPEKTTSTAPSTTTSNGAHWSECDFEVNCLFKNICCFIPLLPLQDEFLCGWQALASPPNLPFFWERTNGKTIVDNDLEGPEHDHALQPQKYFMYANAAQDHDQAEEAVLVSPPIQDPNFCFQFYWMVKPHEGIQALKVSIENTKNKEETVIWQLSEFILDFWEEGRVHIANPEEFTILIKAVRTSKPEGFAAFDDVLIIPNQECQIFPSDAQPPPPVTTTPAPIMECDFENDLCGWSSRHSDFMFNRTNGQTLIDSDISGPHFDHSDSKERKMIRFFNNNDELLTH